MNIVCEFYIEFLQMLYEVNAAVGYSVKVKTVPNNPSEEKKDEGKEEEDKKEVEEGAPKKKRKLGKLR